MCIIERKGLTDILAFMGELGGQIPDKEKETKILFFSKCYYVLFQYFLTPHPLRQRKKA